MIRQVDPVARQRHRQPEKRIIRKIQRRTGCSTLDSIDRLPVESILEAKVDCVYSRNSFQYEGERERPGPDARKGL